MKHDERMNYLFIEENEFDTQIYRIFRPKYFFEMLEDKKMAMMKPELWDDPRENPLKRARFECEDGEGSFAFADDLFCVCWSQCKESDGIWRAYSPENDNIMVSTTPRKLLCALKNALPGEIVNNLCFIGKVQYKKDEEILNSLEDFYLDTSGVEIAKTLLYKELSFLYEREVRLIYNKISNGGKDNIFKFNIEPNEVFEEIIFSSKITEKLENEYKYRLKELGYNFKICKSKIYDPSMAKTMKYKI